MPYLRTPFAERFWSLVDDSGGPDACWPFTRKTGAVREYGRISWNGKLWLAHRAAFALANGREPTGHVCHDCDNPPCCNPAHLYDGSDATNVRDREARGRGGHRESTRRGEGHSRATLTVEQVITIKRLRADGLTYRQIGARVPATKAQIHQICTGRSWAWVSADLARE